MEVPAEAPAKRRRSFWDRKAEICFVELWAQNVDEIRGAHKKTHIYKRMSADFAQRGYKLSVSDIKYKIANLTAKYRKCKEATGPSKASPSEWYLYEAIQKIIGALAIKNVDVAKEERIHSNSQEISMQDTLDVAPSSPPSSINELPPPSPSSSSELPFCANASDAKNTNVEKLISMYEEFGKCYKEAAAENIKMGEEMAKIEKEKLLVLKEMRDDNKKLMQGVLDYLRRLK